MALHQVRGKDVETVFVDPGIHYRSETFGTEMNHKIAWGANMDDQPFWDWMNHPGQIRVQVARPFAGIDQRRNFEAATFGPGYRNQGSVESRRRAEPANLLFIERPGPAKLQASKRIGRQCGRIEIRLRTKRHSARHLTSFLMQQAGLISNAEYPGQSVSRFNAEPVIPLGNPGRPELLGQHVWVAMAPKLHDKTCASLGRSGHLFFRGGSALGRMGETGPSIGWGEELGAPRMWLIAKMFRAGFEPRRGCTTSRGLDRTENDDILGDAKRTRGSNPGRSSPGRWYPV